MDTLTRSNLLDHLIAEVSGGTCHHCGDTFTVEVTATETRTGTSYRVRGRIVARLTRGGNLFWAGECLLLGYPLAVYGTWAGEAEEHVRERLVTVAVDRGVSTPCPETADGA